MTAAELMASKVVLSAVDVALILELRFARGARVGEPDAGRVRALVASGDLVPVDPSQPSCRQTFSVSTVRRYIDSAWSRQLRPISQIGAA